MCLREKIFIDVGVSLIHYVQLARRATSLHYVLGLGLHKSALAVLADAILFLVTVCKNRKLPKGEREREEKGIKVQLAEMADNSIEVLEN